jgi:hypothetical protein
LSFFITTVSDENLSENGRILSPSDVRIAIKEKGFDRQALLAEAMRRYPGFL